MCWAKTGIYLADASLYFRFLWVYSPIVQRPHGLGDAGGKKNGKCENKICALLEKWGVGPLKTEGRSMKGLGPVWAVW